MDQVNLLQKERNQEKWLEFVCDLAQAVLWEHKIESRIAGGYCLPKGLLLSLHDAYFPRGVILQALAAAFRCHVTATAGVILLDGPNPIIDCGPMGQDVIEGEYVIGEVPAPETAPAPPYSLTLTMRVLA